MDEKELIAAVQAGDREAARRLYDRHAARVYRLIYRMTGDAGLAEEYTQDTFVKVFNRLSQFRGDSAFTTWLHSVAMSAVLTGMRKLRRLRTRETGLLDAETVAAATPDDDPHLRERLRAELERLPVRLRLPVVLHDVEGFTHREIAGILGVPEGTSKARLSEGRARLRVALASVAAER